MDNFVGPNGVCLREVTLHYKGDYYYYYFLSSIYILLLLLILHCDL